jgi:hypothetical protein
VYRAHHLRNEVMRLFFVSSPERPDSLLRIHWSCRNRAATLPHNAPWRENGEQLGRIGTLSVRPFFVFLPHSSGMSGYRSRTSLCSSDPTGPDDRPCPKCDLIRPAPG